jgi:hypothetical protein
MVLNNADNVMLGENEVSKIYCGSAVVWERGGSILPPGYTQKEYLQTSGEQVIDTGYTPQTDIFKAEMRVGWFVETNKALVNSSKFNFLKYGSQVYWQTMSNNDAYFSNGSTLNNDNDYTLIIEKTDTEKIMQIDDRIWNKSSNAVIAATSAPIYLFATHYQNNGQPWATDREFITGKCYYCKIYDNDILVRVFIPAVRDSDGKAGFYDLVTNQFFTNAGTGADFTTN